MKATFSHQLKKGFTLVELLVVIAILGALAGVSYPLITSLISQGDVTAANKTCKDIVSGYHFLHLLVSEHLCLL